MLQIDIFAIVIPIPKIRVKQVTSLFKNSIALLADLMFPEVHN